VPRTRRASPRYLRFLLTGGTVGLVVTVVVVLLRGDQVERPTVLFFYLGLLLVGFGALLGGLVAVLLAGPTPKSDPADAKDSTAPHGVPGPPTGSP
jgi:hypothetical protein